MEYENQLIKTSKSNNEIVFIKKLRISLNDNTLKSCPKYKIIILIPY